MVMYLFTCLSFLFSLASAVPRGSSVLCSHFTSQAYDAQVANTSGTFHINYSHGRADLNGPLASESIFWTRNNVDSLGRYNFVRLLLPFMVVAPGVQIRDHIHISDGNAAAVLYTLQGNATQPFEGQPPSNALVQVPGAEMMIFDDDALLNRLITIEDIDLFTMLLEKDTVVSEFDNVPNIQVKETTSAQYVCNNKQAIAMIAHYFTSNQTSKTSSLLSPSITLHPNNFTAIDGAAAVVTHLESFKASFPDLIQHDEYIIGEGLYTAAESILEGTFNGEPFTATNGTVVQPDGLYKEVRVLRFFKHDSQGLITQMWEVRNNNDFVSRTVVGYM